MIYSINTVTNKIISGILGAAFRKGDWRSCTNQEILDYNLQQAKDAKIAEVEAALKAFIYLPVEYSGSTFINSEKSSNALKITKDETEEPIEWLDIDEVQVNLTKAQATELLITIFSHRKSAYFQEASLLKTVRDYSTVTKVKALNATFS